MESPDSSPSRGARLVLIDPDGKRREISVAPTPFRIGRQPGIELTLADSRISRLQARIITTEDGYVLEDTESRHGTFVNGLKVTRHTLCAKDDIDFGIADSYRMLYVGDGAGLDELLEKFTTGAPSTPHARELHHLGILLEVARTFGTGLSLEDVLKAVVDAALQLTRTHRGALLLKESSGKIEPVVARDAEKNSIAPADLRISSSVVRQVMASRRELIVSDVGEETAMGRQESIAGLDLRTVIAVPVAKLPVVEAADFTIATPQGELLGVLYLDSQLPSSAFSDLDREVLRTLAREAAVVVENARLFAAAREKARLDHEIEIASEIQQLQLPKAFPRLPEMEVTGFMLACHSVGGDCFDVMELEGGRYRFFVGDIAGKGISASLLASMLQGTIGSLTLLDIPIDDVISRVNRYIYEHSPEERYATAFYAALDPSGRLDYINAGHVPALILRRSGETESLPSSNLPLGMFPGATYESGAAQISPGDFLVIYTDGVSEATNRRGELLEENGLRQILHAFKGETVDHLSEAVRAGIKKFTEGAPQSDDITVLVAHFRGQA